LLIEVVAVFNSQNGSRDRGCPLYVKGLASLGLDDHCRRSTAAHESDWVALSSSDFGSILSLDRPLEGSLNKPLNGSVNRSGRPRSDLDLRRGRRRCDKVDLASSYCLDLTASGLPAIDSGSFDNNRPLNDLHSWLFDDSFGDDTFIDSRSINSLNLSGRNRVDMRDMNGLFSSNDAAFNGDGSGFTISDLIYDNNLSGSVFLSDETLDAVDTSMFVDAAETIRNSVVIEFLYVLVELILDFSEGDIFMMTDVPCDVGISTTSLVINVCIKNSEDLIDHLAFFDPRTTYPVGFELVVEPDFDFSLLVDTDLFLIHAEEANDVSELIVSVKDGLVEVENVRIGDELDIGKSKAHEFN
jgi:hypothetical protein